MKYNQYIDHTILKPNANKESIIKLCEEAKQYQFASVCVNPYWVKLCSELLAGTDVDVCTVIGFPLGANTKETKAFETKQVIENGATEVDMVINVGALKSKDYQTVLEDIKAVRQASEGKVLKVIIETCLLTDEEKVKACELSVEAKADFVKTSTGFSTGGANVHDVALMKQTVKDQALVKASGGIHTREEMIALIEAGASRIGASSGIALVKED